MCIEVNLRSLAWRAILIEELVSDVAEAKNSNTRSNHLYLTIVHVNAGAVRRGP